MMNKRGYARDEVQRYADEASGMTNGQSDKAQRKAHTIYTYTHTQGKEMHNTRETQMNIIDLTRQGGSKKWINVGHRLAKINRITG